MTLLKDLLLELRAIRLGQQLFLRITTGKEVNLLDMAKLDRDSQLTVPIKPRDHSAIIHKNDNKLRAQETLRMAGDDTMAMIDYVRETVSVEAAEGLKKFYEEEIIGKGER